MVHNIIIRDTLESVNIYGETEKLSANLVREASLDRRLTIALPEMGLFFPVKSMEFKRFAYEH